MVHFPFEILVGILGERSGLFATGKAKIINSFLLLEYIPEIH